MELDIKALKGDVLELILGYFIQLILKSKGLEISVEKKTLLQLKVQINNKLRARVILFEALEKPEHTKVKVLSILMRKSLEKPENYKK